MEGPISLLGYKEQESNLILPEHDDDDDIYIYIYISFIFIPWIRTEFQNPYGYGNSQICLRNLEVKSI